MSPGRAFSKCHRSYAVGSLASVIPAKVADAPLACGNPVAEFVNVVAGSFDMKDIDSCFRRNDELVN